MKTAADPLPHYGAGVALRRLSPSDLVAFQAYRADPGLSRYQGWSVVPDAVAGDLRVVTARAANDRALAGRATAVICFSFPPEQARLGFSS